MMETVSVPLDNASILEDLLADDLAAGVRAQVALLVGSSPVVYVDSLFKQEISRRYVGGYDGCYCSSVCHCHRDVMVTTRSVVVVTADRVVYVPDPVTEGEVLPQAVARPLSQVRGVHAGANGQVSLEVDSTGKTFFVRLVVNEGTTVPSEVGDVVFAASSLL